MPPHRIALTGLALAALLAVGRAPAQLDTASEETPARRVTPALHIRRKSTDLEITGQVSSIAHEAILRETASRFGPAGTVSFQLQEAELLPPGWGLVTELALRAALVTQFSETSVTPASVSIRGVTTDRVAWNTALARLENALLTDMHLDTDVTQLSTDASFENLCKEQFDAVLATRTLEFALGSPALGAAGQALLDSLLETASDCPGAIIGIRANGDGPASVTADRALGEARTQSLVDYLTGRGLPYERIEVMPAAEEMGNRTRAVAFTIRYNDRSADAVAAGTPSP